MLRRASAASALTSDPLPRRSITTTAATSARAERQAARGDRAESTGQYNRAHSRARASFTGAYALGTLTQAGFRDRHRTLPELWRQLEDHRRYRSAAGDSQNSHPFGFAHPRPAALACAASRVADLGPFLPSGLRAETACPSASRRSRSACARTNARSRYPTRPAHGSKPQESAPECHFSRNTRVIAFSPHRR